MEELMELVEAQVRNFFRAQHMELDEQNDERSGSEDGRDWQGAQVIEAFCPERETGRAGDLGFRQGFAMALCGTKPYGPNAGQHWDTSSAADVESNFTTRSTPKNQFLLLDRHLGRYPACRSIQQARKRQHDFCTFESAHTGGRQIQDATFCTSIHHFVLLGLGTLWRSVKCSRDQMYSQSCCCEVRMSRNRPRDKEVRIYKLIQWLTNCSVLAEGLDRRRAKHHRTNVASTYHSPQRSGMRSAAFLLLESIKKRMCSDGQLSAVGLEKLGGLIPSELAFDSADEQND